MKKFWMVWNEGNRDPRFKHGTEEMARIEAERLARLFPGSIFYLLTSVDACKVNDIKWDSEDITNPF